MSRFCSSLNNNNFLSIIEELFEIGKIFTNECRDFSKLYQFFYINIYISTLSDNMITRKWVLKLKILVRLMMKWIINFTRKLLCSFPTGYHNCTDKQLRILLTTLISEFQSNCIERLYPKGPWYRLEYL